MPDEHPLLKEVPPDITEVDMERFYRQFPHRRPVEQFTLPEGVKFEVNLSEVERNRWTPEEYGA